MSTERLKILTVYLLLMTACHPTPNKKVTPAGVTATTAKPTPSEVSSAEAVQPRQYSASAAVFKNDQLAACVDSVWIDPGIEALALESGKSTQFLFDEEVEVFLLRGKSNLGEIIGEEHSALLRPSGKPQTLKKTCREQFPSRTVISSCSLGVSDGKESVGIEFLNFDATGSRDRLMHGCLAAKGDWQELPTDSREFLHERLHQHLQALQQQP